MKKINLNHVWLKFINYECCKICGVVKRKDDKNKPCKGPVSLRPAEGIL